MLPFNVIISTFYFNLGNCFTLIKRFHFWHHRWTVVHQC